MPVVKETALIFLSYSSSYTVSSSRAEHESTNLCFYHFYIFQAYLMVTLTVGISKGFFSRALSISWLHQLGIFFEKQDIPHNSAGEKREGETDLTEVWYFWWMSSCGRYLPGRSLLLRYPCKGVSTRWGERYVCPEILLGHVPGPSPPIVTIILTTALCWDGSEDNINDDEPSSDIWHLHSAKLSTRQETKNIINQNYLALALLPSKSGLLNERDWSGNILS